MKSLGFTALHDGQDGQSMKAKGILWYSGIYLAVLILSFIITVIYVSSLLKRVVYAETRNDLRERAAIVAEFFSSFVVEAGHEPSLFCRRAGGSSNLRITVIALDGKVLGDSHEDPAEMDNHADRIEIRRAHYTGEGFSIRYSATIQRRLMYFAAAFPSHAAAEYILRVSVPVEELRDLLDQIYLEAAIIILLILFLTLAVSLLQWRKITASLNDLKSAAYRYARFDFDTLVSVDRPKELRELSETISTMAMELKKRIASVTEQGSRLEAVLSSMIEAVVICDPEGLVLEMNPSAEQLAGRSKAAAAGRSLIEVFRNSEIETFFRRIRQSGRALSQHILLYREDELHLLVNGVPIAYGPAGKKEGVLLVMNDISRMKVLERIRTDFVSNVSHELKTPVTLIKGFVETLLTEKDLDAASRRKFLRIIDKHSDRLAAIIEDLLRLSRIENEGRETLTLSTVHLTQLVAHLVQNFRELSEQYGISLDVHCPEGLYATLDPGLFERALADLIDNGIKYNQKGGRTSIWVDEDKEGTVFIVDDTGPGIPEQERERIFERFYRIDKGRSRESGGTGLGLSIVKHIVLLHNGTIEVLERPGGGSRFRIWIPHIS
jgi:two-component system phosphate regulon sensor histidine kinase PhoR